ncbi:MAG: SDR family oxidoreductase [Myxococcales bacterium]|nr:SDR family oxidoreductase [Myxococcales bacterium]
MPAPYVEVGTVAEVRRAAAEGHSLWLRGAEAAGPVSGTSALVLIRAAVATGKPWVVEGLSVAAQAACASVGAAGTVLGPELWLRSGNHTPAQVAARLRQVTGGRDTSLRGELLDRRRRVLTIPGGDPVDAPQSVAAARHHADQTAAAVLDAVRAETTWVQGADPRGVLASDPVGAGTCVVQGPMANVAERTGLAVRVRAAGGLPFAALGALDPDRARAVLRDWSEQVPGPWGAGIIGFEMMPHRDAHIDALLQLEQRPAAVLVAGGSVALARRLAVDGLQPWLHTPSPRLMADALQAGVRAVVLEGHEAGGHVGALTSLGLWEEGLREAVRAVEAGGTPPLVVLAGGIGDAASAAVAASLAAPAAAVGVRIALQVGTAFFFTHDIVEAGQITAAYQAEALAAQRTVLVGSSVNLPLRVPAGLFAEDGRRLELALEARGMARSERRHQLEAHNLGRTRIAAKGVERNPDHSRQPEAPRYRPVGLDRQLQEGAFTMGQGAACSDALQTVAQLVEKLTEGATALLAGRSDDGPWGVVAPVQTPSPARRRVQPTSDLGSGGSVPIAVVGLGCVLPGADDIVAFWRNLVEGVDAIGPLDPERWGAFDYFDPDAGSQGPSLTYARHAGHLGKLAFDPLAFRIPPRILPTVERSQQLALMASAEAVRRAGWDRAGSVDRRRAAVVLGNAMGGEHAKSLAVRVRFREVLDAVRRDSLAHGWTVGDLAGLHERVEARLQERLPPVEVDSMAGLLSNVVAGRVASWLDWMGGNLTVDAACAASLAAVAVAVDWLRTDRCDAVLAGGVDSDMTAETYVGFSRTQALSRTGSSPFSSQADGFVMGEGAAVLALKRLPDALRDGDPVWAVIEGVGQSSDGRGRSITAPRAEGQTLALQRACADAGIAPGDVAMVEAHGTGTALGDRTEVGVLARVVGDQPPVTWLGSVKSMIGHLKGAAGAAGLTKAVLSLRAGVVPPTLHAGPVNPDLGLQQSGLALPRAPVALPPEARAGVSAFGFGGTNFHLVLGSPPTDAPRPPEIDELHTISEPLMLPPEVSAWSPDDVSPLLLAYGAPDRAELQHRVASDRPGTADQVAACPHRLVVVADPTDRASAVQRAATWLSQPGAPPPPGVFAGEGEAKKVALWFPGQGAQRRGAVDSLRRHPAGARTLHRLEQQVQTQTDDARSLRRREGDDAGASADPEDLHATMFALGVGWASVLQQAGVPFAATAGHSLGAYAALVAARWWTEPEALGSVLARARALTACPPGRMLAVRLPADRALAVAEEHGLAVAAHNAPDAHVLAGPIPAISAAAEALGSATARPLAVERAYHSPAVGPAAHAMRAVLQGATLTTGPVTVFSTRTASPVSDPREDLACGIEEPVRFHDTVAALRAAGHELFVEAGPGSTLSSLARSLGATAVALDPTPGDGGRGTVRAAAALLAHGHPGLCRALPGTLVQRPLPAHAPPPALPADPPTSRPSSSAPTYDEALAQRARAVQDLRIAALADPSYADAHATARAALLDALAHHDAATAGTPQPPGPVASPAALASSTAPPLPDTAVALAPREPPGADAPTDLHRIVRDAVCEVTGYPPEFVEDGADLEADLGVDSIRKMEILALLEKRVGFTTPEADYATLVDADLSRLVAHVERRLQDADDAPVQATVPTSAHASAWLGVLAAEPQPDPTPLADTSVWFHQDQDDVGQVVERLVQLASRDLPDPLTAVVRPDLAGAAATGYLRSLARETGRPLRLVHAGPDVPPSEIARELGDPERPAEVWLTPEGARATRLVTFRAGATPHPHSLTQRPVVLVSGGAGIAVPCLSTWAALRPRVVLLGRRDASAAEPTLTALAELGIEAEHLQCDLTDADQVHAAVGRVRERIGAIDVVLHAAGVLRDGVAQRTSRDDVAAVLGPKLSGARHLAQATSDDALALWVTLSSVVAHVGNPGQTLYGAANAALESLVHPSAARSVSLAFTSWGEVGMAADPALQRVLLGRGIRSLSNAAGAEAFQQVLDSDVHGTVLVLAEPPDHAQPLPWPLTAVVARSADTYATSVDLTPEQPALADHQVSGRPLVAAAVWVAALLATARLARPEVRSWELEDLHVAAPTFVDRARDDVRVRVSGQGSTLLGEVTTADATVCTARLSPCGVPARHPPPEPLASPEPAAALYRPTLLFHGPTWRVRRTVQTNGNGLAEADLETSPRLDPMASAVDAAHQLLCTWADRSEGWLGLPVGADRWVVGPEAGVPHRLITEAHTDEAGEVTATVTVLDETGRVALRGEGVRLRAATRRPGGPQGDGHG